MNNATQSNGQAAGRLGHGASESIDRQQQQQQQEEEDTDCPSELFDRALARNRLGMCCLERGQLQDAMEHFQTAFGCIRRLCSMPAPSKTSSSRDGDTTTTTTTTTSSSSSSSSSSKVVSSASQSPSTEGDRRATNSRESPIAPPPSPPSARSPEGTSRRCTLSSTTSQFCRPHTRNVGGFHMVCRPICLRLINATAQTPPPPTTELLSVASTAVIFNMALCFHLKAVASVPTPNLHKSRSECAKQAMSLYLFGVRISHRNFQAMIRDRHAELSSGRRDISASNDAETHANSCLHTLSSTAHLALLNNLLHIFAVLSPTDCSNVPRDVLAMLRQAVGWCAKNRSRRTLASRAILTSSAGIAAQFRTFCNIASDNLVRLYHRINRLPAAAA